jgi:hypothetical protein
MVIQTSEELANIQQRLNTEPVYILPIFVNQYTHPAGNTVSSLHLLFTDGQYVCVPYHHLDAKKIQLDMSAPHKIFTLYKKDVLLAFNPPQETVVDIASILDTHTQPLPELRDFYTPNMVSIKNQFKFLNLHLAIPLTNWMECGESFLKHLQTLHQQYSPDDSFNFINTTIIPTLAEIERVGLYVDEPLLVTHFGEPIKKYITKNKVYSSYNLYTTTGRPSNAYGGINFSALNKTDGARTSFTSRFGENGILVQFDYEAFHLRLVGSKIDYKLPDISLHTYLAQQYYNVSEVTPDQYEESKARTFAIMYGQTDDIGDVEFFHKIREYSQKLWTQYETDGYVLSSKNRKIVVPTPSQNKVFNYMMQLTETEEAITRIKNVVDFLLELQSKVVLYTYDAVLLDCHISELDILPVIETLLSHGGFNVRQYRGHNYNELTTVKT